MKLFVVDPHTIYRRGLAASLEGRAEVDSVGQAGSVRDAWEQQALLDCDLVLSTTRWPAGPTSSARSARRPARR